MPRPTTKIALITEANTNFAKMWQLIDSMPPVVQSAEFNFGSEVKQKEPHWARDKNLRDVLVHLYEWHNLLLNWASKNQGGESTPFIPLPYNWKTYSEMNVAFREKHQNTPYADAIDMLKSNHEKVLELIESFTDEQLFTPQYFSWTGTSTLGSYCISATSSHYNWAIKKIKAHQKSHK